MNNDERRQDTSKQVLLSVLGVAILIVAVVGISFAAFTYSRAGEKTNTVTTGTIEMHYIETTNGINITNAVPMDETTATSATVVSNSDNDNVFDFTVDATIAGDTKINYEVVAVKANSTDADCTDAVYTGAKKIGTADETKTVPADTENGTDAVPGDADKYAECSLVSDKDIRLRLDKSADNGSTYTKVVTKEGFTVDTATKNDTTGRDALSDGMQLTTGQFSTSGKSTDYYRLWMWVDTNYVIDGHARTYQVKVNVYGKATT